MLLPSALPCGPRPRLQRMAAFSSLGQIPQQQPSSPKTPQTEQGIGGTCNALQSILGTESRNRKSPRASNLNSALHSRARVSKRPPPPPRSRILGKRTLDDDYDDEDETDRAIATHGYGLGLRLGDQREQRSSGGQGSSKISTPKRLRRAPPSLPFGLDHDDFLGLPVDEGLDDTMTEEGLGRMETEKAIPDDEGYGSMEFQPGQLRAAMLSSSSSDSNSSHKQLQIRHPFQDQQYLLNGGSDSPFLQPPSRGAADSDAMSIGTPYSGLAAMALSPKSVHLGERGPSPSCSFPPSSLQTDPIASPQKDTADPPLPTLPLPSSLSPASLSVPFRPTLHRLPSLAHSDPLLPTPFTPTHQGNAPSFFDWGNDLPRPSTPKTEPRAAAAAAAAAEDKAETTLSGTAKSDHHHHSSSTSSSWSDADDRALVALVLDKLRLKKCEWDACARALGADGHGASLGRRWRDLVGDGCVGLKFRYGGAVVGYRRPTTTDREGATTDAGDQSALAHLGRRLPAVRSRARRGDVRAVRWS